jgi:transcriptional regulator with GAF, ATPase, and Fis domain
VERDNIERALTQAGGKIYGRDGAAALLGLKPTTLAYRMKALGIPHPRS